MARAIILGGYGLIGAACLRALADAGFDVTGIGRSATSAHGIDPRADWLIRDIPAIPVADWRDILQGVAVVVNAAGALQDGSRDDLHAIHVTALARLTEAAKDLPLRLIQISAARVSPQASTRFFRSKAEGDALVRRLPDWVILRPTLVLAREAYGGTALLRATAALPGILPQVMPEAPIQTISLDDLAQAVVASANREIPHGTEADLTSAESHNLPELALAFRRWLGLPEPRFRPRISRWTLPVISGLADALGHLGWRSPLRSTALRSLSEGITGDPGPWTSVGGRPCRPLAETLAAHPATRADRLAARTYFALPLAVTALAIFWTLTGLITLAAPDRAIPILTSRGMTQAAAALLVLAGALADITLGLLILWRNTAGRAALGMALLSGAYLVGSLFTAPDLWADPLGPMLKVLPGLVLALWVWLMLEDR